MWNDLCKFSKFLCMMYASFCYGFTNWIFYVRYWKGKTETGQCFKCDWFLHRKWMTWCITAIRSSYFCYKSQASARPFSTGSHAKLSWTAVGTFHKKFLFLFYNMLFSPQFALTDGLQAWQLLHKYHSSLEGFIEKSFSFFPPMRKTVQLYMTALLWITGGMFSKINNLLFPPKPHILLLFLPCQDWEPFCATNSQ